MNILKVIIHNRKTLIISFLCVAVFYGSSFLPRFWPSIFSPTIRFFYFISIPLILIGVSLIGLVSMIFIFIAHRGKKLPNKLSIIAASLLLSFIVLTPLTFVGHRYRPRPLPIGSDLIVFDSKLWQTESSTDWNKGISIREQMLKDVVGNILPGKNKKEIEKLLGPSLQTDYFKSIDKDLIYYLGPERDGIMNIDSEWLLIWLDENGQFKRYKIVND